MSYFYIIEEELKESEQPPKGMTPCIIKAQSLLPSMVGKLHENFYHWNKLGLSPGPIQPNRIWFDDNGLLAFHFQAKEQPTPLMHTGFAPYLAAWLVLLNRWMETYVVIARAGAIWSVGELVSALSFTTPAFLPKELVAGLDPTQPNQWDQIAHALAMTIVDRVE